jgi:Geminivirus Rep catalytic domain
MEKRLQSKQLYLTYSRCDMLPEDVLAQLQTMLPVDLYLIATEPHKDGYPHIHAYIKCTKTQDIRKHDKLHLPNHKGNYQTCRNIEAVRNYCKKGSAYITNIIGFQPVAAAVRVIEAAYESTEQAMEIVKNNPHLARDYIKDTARMEQSIARLKITETYVETRYRFKTLLSMARWKRTKYALWLKGPTGTGKTEYAKTLFTRPILVSNMEDLKKLHDTHDGIIFDDMSFKHWPRETQIHLVDLENDRTFNVKYGSVTIKRGTPRIFTSNVGIFMYDPAIKRRLRYIEIKEDLRLLEEIVESDTSNNSLEPDENVFN